MANGTINRNRGGRIDECCNLCPVLSGVFLFNTMIEASLLVMISKPAVLYLLMKSKLR